MFRKLPLLFLALGASALANPLGQPSPLFERVFKMPRMLDPALVEQVKALEPGKRLELDTNNDGKIDEQWYLDTDKRHTIQPMLVRCVDEDGDMTKDGRGDLDSDLYFWDHHADGYIDNVIDYVDDDGDNDLDQMGIFFDKQWPDEKDDITVWWAVDVGDDNLLWYDVNGNYYQDLCQWRTHFSGDELFYQFRIAGDEPVWMNMYEDPFAFYNLDKDSASEMVIRITAVGYDIQNLRYSIDADDDADDENLHNYDFSVTALPGEAGMSWKGAEEQVLEIRGIKTHPVLPWSKTKDFAQNAPWAKAMFIWDELNSNTDGNVDQDPNERWEGLLNQKSKNDDFPQVGGPPCGPVNKRMEISTKPASPLQLYFDPADQRFHLLGADYGYMDVDYNFDGKLDAAYTWKDTSGDGVLDVKTVDVDADGVVDVTLPVGKDIEKLPLEMGQIIGPYMQMIQRNLQEHQPYFDSELSAGTIAASVAEVIDYYKGPLAEYHTEREIGKRIQNSPAGALFYSRLAMDRLLHQLGQEGRTHRFEAKAEPRTPFEYHGQTYRQYITIGVSPGSSPWSSQPRRNFQVDLEGLLVSNSDFNSDNCVVVDGDHWLVWRPVSQQIDDWDIDGRKRLRFQVDLSREVVKTYYLYYAPEGEPQLSFPQLTSAVLDNPAYVAWESDAGAYRFYTGQFDFFGKNKDLYLPREKRLIYPLVDVNYHEQQEWGIDALHVGKTSGLGGLTMYYKGKEYPIQSPAGEGHVQFEHRVLGAGPVRAGVEILAKNVIPEDPEEVVVIRCFIYAGHAETEVNVQLPKGYEDAQIGVGLMNLEGGTNFKTDSGAIGVWGRQSDEIGEIGLALKVNSRQSDSGPAEPLVREVIELPEERQVLTNTMNGWVKYWILGTWRRGMQYPVAPTAENWQKTVENWEQQFTLITNSSAGPAEAVSE